MSRPPSSLSVARRAGAAAVVAACLALPCRAARWEKIEDCKLVLGEFMDGDSFHVQHGMKEYIFRLYFVDAPETDTALRERIEDQAAYWKIPPARIPRIGRKAARTTAKWLKPGFTVYTQWEDAGGASHLPRFFGVVMIGKTDLAEVLVSEGLARIYGATATLPNGLSADTFRQRLEAHENRARQKKKGVWSSVDEPEEDEEAVPEEEAEEAPEPAGPRWPNVPTVAFLRAEAFINLERFEEAEPELRALLEKYPDHPQKPRIEFYIGLCVAMQERFDDAIALLGRWMKDYPDDPLRSEAEFWLPIAMYYKGDHEQALPLFAAYAERYPMSVYAPEAEYRAALCRYALEDFKECAMELGAWLEKHPDHYFRWEARVTRADALAAIGMLDPARDNYLAACTPEAGAFYYLALTQLARVYKALATEKDFEDMAAAFARFIREMPESGNVVDAAYQAGWALRQAGRGDEARRLYWGVLEQYGDRKAWEGFDTLLDDLALLYRDLPDGTFEADHRRKYGEALESARMTLASRLALAEIRQKPEDERAAEAAAFEKRFQPDVLGAEGLAFLGAWHAQAGRPERALPLFERLLSAFPGSRYAALAHTRLAGAELEAGRNEEALEHATRALDSAAEPEVLMEATLMLARSLERLGRYEDAAQAYTTALSSRATPRRLKPEALLGLAACREALDQTREAIPYYQRVYVMYGAYTDAVAAAYLRSGKAFEKLNDIEAAVKTYREMLGLESLAGTPEAAEARRRLSELGS